MDDMLHDVLKRPFIMIGMVAFTLLVPMAITSPRRAARAVGGARWKMIHRAVYAVAVLGVLHYWWMRTAKHNLEEPILFACVVAALLAARLLPWMLQRWQQGQAGGASVRQA
jgi:sulfoxide reductase heme-binding subunit YedZ